MKKYNFWTSIKFKDVSAEANVLTSTWAMNKKFSGVHIARLNTRGYEQVDGVHYYSANIASPVNNDMNILKIGIGNNSSMDNQYYLCQVIILAWGV